MRPSLQRALDRVRNSVLSEVPVAGRSDERRDDPQPLGRQGVGERSPYRTLGVAVLVT